MAAIPPPPAPGAGVLGRIRGFFERIVGRLSEPALTAVVQSAVKTADVAARAVGKNIVRGVVDGIIGGVMTYYGATRRSTPVLAGGIQALTEVVDVLMDTKTLGEAKELGEAISKLDPEAVKRALFKSKYEMMAPFEEFKQMLKGFKFELPKPKPAPAPAPAPAKPLGVIEKKPRRRFR